MFNEPGALLSPLVRELEASTANEELVERITVVRAIAMISLPLPHPAEPWRGDRREAA
jgi:hypothetical protein